MNDAPATTVSEIVDARTPARERRKARNLLELTELFDSRDDIRGISAVADFFAEGVRWSA